MVLLRDRPGDRYEPLRDELLALCTTQAQSRYITDRWSVQVQTAHLAGSKARDYLYLGRFLGLGAATMLPAVVSAQAAFHSIWWTSAAVGLSLVVALSSGFVEITRSRQRWQLYRRLREELESIGWELCLRPGNTSAHGFDHFHTRVESALRDFQRGYFDEIANPPDQLPARTDDRSR